MDGTLIDTEKTGVLSLQQTIKELMGMDMPYDQVYHYFGIPSHKVAPLLGYGNPEEFAHRWEKNFISLKYMMNIFPGVGELLSALKKAGIRMGVVSSRSRFEMDNDEVFGEYHHYFDFIITSEDSEGHKPDPDPVFAYLKKASAAEGREVLPSECLYIGDTMHDCKCAHSAGCDFALADWNCRGMQGIPSDFYHTAVPQLLSYLD